MILIQGAGIAGLTLAGLLEQHKLDYLIIDRCNPLIPAGAGLVLQRNALEVLNALTSDAIETASQSIAAMTIGTVSKPDLQHIDLTSSTRSQGIHRADLQALLLSQIPGARLRLGCSVSSWRQINGDLEVTLNSGDRLRVSTLVGADGAGSEIRAELLGTPERRDSRQWCARTIITGQPTQNRASEIHHGRSRLGVVPLTGGRSYVFWVRSEHDGSLLEAHEIQQDIVTLGTVGTAVYDCFTHTQSWLQHPLIDIPPAWGKQNVVLIGDAAHALTPNLGQGAALGIEDALALSQLISDAPLKSSNLADRLKAVRGSRVSAVRRVSYIAGRIAHLQNPLLQSIRNLVLKHTPPKTVQHNLERWLESFISTIPTSAHKSIDC